MTTVMSAASVSVSVVAVLLLLTFGSVRGRGRGNDDCSISDIVVQRKDSAPLPDGTPTYEVTVLNLCRSEHGCPLGDIHLSCGAFSSAGLDADPKVFRLLSTGDCLVNDGRPLSTGSSVSFQYANASPFPMDVSKATCVCS